MVLIFRASTGDLFPALLLLFAMGFDGEWAQNWAHSLFTVEADERRICPDFRWRKDRTSKQVRLQVRVAETSEFVYCLAA